MKAATRWSGHWYWRQTELSALAALPYLCGESRINYSFPFLWSGHTPHDRSITYPDTLRHPLSRQPISGTPEFIISKLVSSLRCSGFCEDENLLLSKLDVTRLTYIYISCSSFWVCCPFSLPFSAAHMDATLISITQHSPYSFSLLRFRNYVDLSISTIAAIKSLCLWISDCEGLMWAENAPIIQAGWMIFWPLDSQLFVHRHLSKTDLGWGNIAALPYVSQANVPKLRKSFAKSSIWIFYCRQLLSFSVFKKIVYLYWLAWKGSCCSSTWVDHCSNYSIIIGTNTTPEWFSSIFPFSLVTTVTFRVVFFGISSCPLWYNVLRWTICECLTLHVL